MNFITTSIRLSDNQVVCGLDMRGSDMYGSTVYSEGKIKINRKVGLLLSQNHSSQKESTHFFLTITG